MASRTRTDCAGVLRRAGLAAAIALCLATTGCASVGPVVDLLRAICSLGTQ